MGLLTGKLMRMLYRSLLMSPRLLGTRGNVRSVPKPDTGSIYSMFSLARGVLPLPPQKKVSLLFENAEIGEIYGGADGTSICFFASDYKLRPR
jgi:hypothetical protein